MPPVEVRAAVVPGMSSRRRLEWPYIAEGPGVGRGVFAVSSEIDVHVPTYRFGDVLVTLPRREFAEAGWADLNDATLALLQQVSELQRQLLAVQQQRTIQVDQPRISAAVLHDLGPRWTLSLPLHVTVESYDDHVIARIPDLSAYGEGDTEQEALSDLRQNVIEGREGLEGGTPGSELAERWLRLIQPAEVRAA